MRPAARVGPRRDTALARSPRIRRGRWPLTEMEIALIGEGTYPYQFGGVSVWCDQLVRGMPAYDFKVVALVSTGIEPVRFELPDNVASVLAVPLWGPVPPGPRPKRNAMSSFR